MGNSAKTKKKSESHLLLGKKLGKMAEETREKIKSAITECVDYVEAFVAISRNFIANYPGKDQVEEKVDKLIKNMAAQLNIPNRDETEKLAVAIDLLNQRLDSLYKK